MKRRDFLKTGVQLGALAGVAASPFGRCWAQTEEAHFFVLFRVTNGWDVTLSLDPKTHGEGTDQNDVFLEYRPEDILRKDSLALGPAAAVLGPYMSDLSVINGVHMRRDGGHQANLNYMSSGKGDGLSSFLPVELAYALKAPTFFNVGVLGGSTQLGNRLVTLMDVSSYLGSSNGLDLSLLFDEDLTGDYGQAVKAFKKSQPILSRIRDDFQGRQAFDETHKAQILARLCADKVLECVQIDFNKNLDTHSAHPQNHLAQQKEVWEEIAGYFKAFKETPFGESNLFDHTTFMAISEFSRTPALNTSQGKDHNPYTNSVLLAGKGINRGRVIGESRVLSRKTSVGGMSKHMALPLDYRSGEIYRGNTLPPSKAVNLIFPEDVARTVAGIFGNPTGFETAPLSLPVIPGVIKS